MRALNFAEAVELATLGGDVAAAFAELRHLPLGQIRRGNPKYERWRELALRMHDLTGRAPAQIPPSFYAGVLFDPEPPPACPI